MKNINTRTIAFIASFFIAPAQAVPLFFSGTGNSYEVISGSFTWAGAKAAAEALTFNSVQGHLVTITTSAEQTFIEDNLLGSSQLWLGGTDSAVEGEWRWVTGELFWLGGTGGSVQGGLFANWLSDQPDNFNGAEHYLILTTTGDWNDGPSPNPNPGGYIVEFDNTGSELVCDTLREEIAVPAFGASVFSTTNLAAGVTYRLQGSGTHFLTSDTSSPVDAEYLFSGTSQFNGCTGGGFPTCDYGIKINEPVVGGGQKFPDWGAFNGSHVYEIDFVGLGAPIEINLHDDNYSDNSAVDLTLSIFSCGAPTFIDLASFDAIVQDGFVTLSWTTGTEIDNAGFNILRSENADGPYSQINSLLILAKATPPGGASYSFVDDGVEEGNTYFYVLGDIDTSGDNAQHGPLEIAVVEGAIASFDVSTEQVQPVADDQSSTPKSASGGCSVANAGSGQWNISLLSVFLGMILWRIASVSRSRQS